MAIKIVFDTKPSEYNKVIKDFTDDVGKAFFDCLDALGIELVERAKNSKQFKNVTFNLVSSIGYQIGRYGKVVKSSFSTGRRIGAAKGRELASQIIAENSQYEFVLVVVAGMNYAVQVEARGKDVLTSTRIYAEKRIPAMLESLQIT